MMASAHPLNCWDFKESLRSVRQDNWTSFSACWEKYIQGVYPECKVLRSLKEACRYCFKLQLHIFTYHYVWVFHEYTPSSSPEQLNPLCLAEATFLLRVLIWSSVVGWWFYKWTDTAGCCRPEARCLLQGNPAVQLSDAGVGRAP